MVWSTASLMNSTVAQGQQCQVSLPFPCIMQLQGWQALAHAIKFDTATSLHHSVTAKLALPALARLCPCLWAPLPAMSTPELPASREWTAFACVAQGSSKLSGTRSSAKQVLLFACSRAAVPAHCRQAHERARHPGEHQALQGVCAVLASQGPCSCLWEWTAPSCVVVLYTLRVRLNAVRDAPSWCP